MILIGNIVFKNSAETKKYIIRKAENFYNLVKKIMRENNIEEDDVNAAYFIDHQKEAGTNYSEENTSIEAWYKSFLSIIKQFYENYDGESRDVIKSPIYRLCEAMEDSMEDIYKDDFNEYFVDSFDEFGRIPLGIVHYYDDLIF